jgi:pimeloyl-ACP methyl ester carboxylesterase
LDGSQIHAPILEYLENFVVAFVDTLEKITPIKHRFAGVIGGSLGGNLGLRLGQHDLTESPWLKAGIVSWSAACVWGPLVNSLTNSIAPGMCWSRSIEIEIEDEPAGVDSRNLYFNGVYDQAAVWTAGTRTQPEMWYRDGWEPCKALHIQGSRFARQEIYDANLRQWHWRVACEQLIFSHVDHVDHDKNKPFRYELNKVRQLLVAGDRDNFAGTEIYKCTVDLVRDGMAIVNTPGRSLFLKETGHSVHLERPHYFAGEIVNFLPGVESSHLDVSYLLPLLLEPERRTDVSYLVPLLLSEPEAER